MTKLHVTILSTFLLSNPIWAHSATPVIETNSLSKAALEITAANYKPQTAVKTDSSFTFYNHQSEKNNSLFRGALAKQGVKVNLIVNKESKVSYSRYTYPKGQTNSLFRGAMSK